MYLTASTNSAEGATSTGENELAVIVPAKNKNPMKPITLFDDTDPLGLDSMSLKNLIILVFCFVFCIYKYYIFLKYHSIYLSDKLTLMKNEKLYNIWLQFKSFIRFVFKIKPNLNKPKDVNFYRLVFSDFFIGNKLDDNKWFIGQPWGDFHPDSLYQYYGKSEDFVEIENGSLNLYTRYSPKKFYDFKNNINIIIPYGIGLVISKKSFKYGYYEVNGILPTGKLLWPAIWLTAEKTWPPEIDILEAYSGKKSDYSNQFGIPFVKFEPNIHYGFVEDKTKSSYGAKVYPLPFNPSQRPVTYAVHWTEKFIKFYYDGYLIFQTEKKEILDYFNREDVKMNIIINNAYHPRIDGAKYDPSVFKINYVKFFAKN